VVHFGKRVSRLCSLFLISSQCYGGMQLFVPVLWVTHALAECLLCVFWWFGFSVVTFWSYYLHFVFHVVQCCSVLLCTCWPFNGCWLFCVVSSCIMEWGCRKYGFRWLRLSFVDPVCWSWTGGIFLWCSCVFLRLWFVICSMCFRWFCCYVQMEYMFFKFCLKCSSDLPCVFLGTVNVF
jgi:hypothetical protein